MMNKTIAILIIIASVIVASCVTTMAESLPSHIVSAKVDEDILSENYVNGDAAVIVGVVIEYGSIFSSNKKRILFSDMQVPGCDVVRYEYFPSIRGDYRKIIFYCR